MITAENATDLQKLVTDIVEDAAALSVDCNGKDDDKQMG